LRHFVNGTLDRRGIVTAGRRDGFYRGHAWNLHPAAQVPGVGKIHDAVAGRQGLVNQFAAGIQRRPFALAVLREYSERHREEGNGNRKPGALKGHCFAAGI